MVKSKAKRNTTQKTDKMKSLPALQSREEHKKPLESGGSTELLLILPPPMSNTTLGTPLQLSLAVGARVRSRVVFNRSSMSCTRPRRSI